MEEVVQSLVQVTAAGGQIMGRGDVRKRAAGFGDGLVGRKS